MTRYRCLAAMLSFLLALAGVVIHAGIAGQPPSSRFSSFAGTARADGQPIQTAPAPAGTRADRGGKPAAQALPVTEPRAWMWKEQQKDAVCPAGWCDAVPGRVLVKLKAPSASTRLALMAGAKDRAAAREAERKAALTMLQGRGVLGLQALFPKATPPGAGAQVEQAGGGRMMVPDLTRWYVATVSEGTDVKALAARLKDAPGVQLAEPDYLAQAYRGSCPTRQPESGACRRATTNRRTSDPRGDDGRRGTGRGSRRACCRGGQRHDPRPENPIAGRSRGPVASGRRQGS